MLKLTFFYKLIPSIQGELCIFAENNKEMKQVFIALVALLIIGCAKEKEGYSISGDLKNMEDGKMVYVLELDANNQPKVIDSVAVKDGEFFLQMPVVQTPNLSFINIEGIEGNVLFISENEPVEFKIYTDSIQASEVSGGEENKVFRNYLNHLKDLNTKVTTVRTDMRNNMMGSKDSLTMVKLQKEEEAIRNSDLAHKKQIVKEHKDNFVSVLVLTDMLNLQAPAREVNELYTTISEDLKQTPLAKSLKQNLEVMLVTEVGSKAPEFEAPNPDGKVIALNEVLGKVTLLDFWASWCKPCRMENPNVVNVFNKYHDKGFNIIQVSLDREGQHDKWVEAIKEDNLTWNHESNLQFWNDPVARLYNIKAIPAAFLLDENGVIVATNLRGDALEAKVKEMIEK